MDHANGMEKTAELYDVHTKEWNRMFEAKFLAYKLIIVWYAY